MTQRVQPSLVLNGAEVLNWYRTWSYLRLSALVPPGVFAGPPECACSALWRDLGSPAFVSPAADPAPWYTSAQAASADFLGALITDVEGLDASMVDRDSERLAGDGARLARQRTGPFTLTFRATLVARSDDGMTYGRLWLANRLAACTACEVRTATVRLACPPDNGSDDSRARYTLYGVGLTKGVAPTDRPIVTDCPYLLEVEFELVAEDGYLYNDPAAALAQRILVPQDWTDSFAVDTIASGLWVVEAGAVTITGGEARPSVGQTRLRRAGVAAVGDRTLWRNEVLRARFRTGTTIAGHTHSLAARWRNPATSAASYLLAHCTQSTGGRIQLYDIRDNGVTTNLLDDQAAGALAANTDYWLRFVIRDDFIVAEHWLTNPVLGGTPAATASTPLTPELRSMHPQGAVGVAFWNVTDTAERLDDFAVEELAGPAEEYLGLAVSGPDWLGDAATIIPTPEHCTLIPGPTSGETGALVTIQAGTARDVTNVVVHGDQTIYPSDDGIPGDHYLPLTGSGDPLLPTDGSYPSGVLIRRVPRSSVMVVDTARRAATMTVDGLDLDGGFLLGAPSGGAFGWPVATRCDDERVCVQPLSYGSDDGTALLTVQTRTRQR